MMENELNRMNIDVTPVPASSELSMMSFLISMTWNSASSASSVYASAATSSSSASSSCSTTARVTFGSARRLLSSSVSPGFRSSAASPLKLSSSSLEPDSPTSISRPATFASSAPRTSSRPNSALSCPATSGSLNSTRRSFVTSSLSSTPVVESPRLDMTMVLIWARRSRSAWALSRGTSTVGSMPANPPLLTIPAILSLSLRPSRNTSSSSPTSTSSSSTLGSETYTSSGARPSSRASPPSSSLGPWNPSSMAGSMPTSLIRPSLSPVLVFRTETFSPICGMMPSILSLADRWTRSSSNRSSVMYAAPNRASSPALVGTISSSISFSHSTAPLRIE